MNTADADRLGPFLERLSRLSVDDLAIIALPEPDAATRLELLQRALDAAERAGRGAESRAAPGRARDQLLDAFARRAYEPTWFGPNWSRSLGRADDRARLLVAVADAAVAESVADLIDEDDVTALRGPFEIVASMSGAAASSNPRVNGRNARTGVAGVVVVTSLVGGFAAIGPLVIAGLAGLASLRRRRRQRGG
ncbi:MAG: hypothetical protein QOF49_779 [Chloroflexota bacterium]|nr:hypothetical protein [Chloroflexota bacterium]